jgi:hypothetical protein
MVQRNDILLKRAALFLKVSGERLSPIYDETAPNSIVALERGPVHHIVIVAGAENKFTLLAAVADGLTAPTS